jgi:hypothetical protein
MRPDDDPGWAAAIPIIGFLPPFRVQSRHRLTLARRLFVAFPSTLVLLGVVLPFITAGSERNHVSATVPFGLALAGVVGIGLASWARARRLDMTSPDTLVASFQTNMILGIAFSEYPALFAFAAVLITHQVWLYAIGFAASSIGLAVIAPTRRAIERKQEQISALGSPLSLAAAFAAGPVSPLTGRPLRMPDPPPRPDR